MLGRGFLLGVAIGIGIGVYAAPMLGKPGIGFNEMKHTVSTIGNLTKKSPDPATWPTNQNAKEELFRFSDWNFAGFGESSNITVNRCIMINDKSMACELLANLSWLKDEKRIEAVFEGTPGNWRMAAAKTQRNL